MGKNRIRTILALTLALAMVLTGVPGAFADVEFGDVKSIYVKAENDNDENLVQYCVDDGEMVPAESNFFAVGNVDLPEGQYYSPVIVYTNDGQVSLTTGDVTSGWDYDPAVRISAEGANNVDEISFRSMQVTAAGEGVQVDNDGGTVDAVIGGIDAAGTGLNVNGNSYDRQSHGSYAAEGGNTLTTTVTVEGDVNVVSDENGTGVSAITYRDGESASVTVNGTVTVIPDPEDGAQDLLGVELQALEGELTGTVTGDIIIQDGGWFAAGASAYADAPGTAVLDVGGDIVVTSEGTWLTRGVITMQSEGFFMNGFPPEAMSMGDVSVTVAGAVSVSGAEEAVGVDAYQAGTGTTEVYVGKGIEASSDDAAGIIATTGSAEAEVIVTVEDGGVKAAGKDSLGIGTWNGGGTIEVTVNGGVESEGTGIALVDRQDGELAEDRRASGETKAAITGDVIAGVTAIEADLTVAASAMDVIVDGMVEGGEHAVVVSSDTIGENLTLTVWKVTPNENGSVVERRNADGEAFTEDEQLEKQVQYIIRIDDSSKDYLTTSGTTEYEGYQVAHEGDTVLVKLTLPEGKELAAAYWDEEQTEAGKLLQDEEGNYYVEVPRGGGVVLSLILQDAPVDPVDPVDPVNPAGPAGNTGAAAVRQAPVILTIRDTTGKTEIAFRADGRFEAKYEDGSVEKGTFRLADGQVVLANSKGHEMPVSKDGGGFKLVYTAGTGAGDFEFLLGEPDVQILVDALS